MAFPGAKWISGALEVEEENKRLRGEVIGLKSTLTATDTLLTALLKRFDELDKFIKTINNNDLILAIEDAKIKRLTREANEKANIAILDRNAGVIGRGGEGTCNDQFNEPRGIAIYPRNKVLLSFNIDKAPHVYVVDSKNNRVQVFDAKSLEYMYSIGTGVAGNGVDQFNNPLSVAILLPNEKYAGFPNNGLLYVSDSENGRVQVFDVKTRGLHLSIINDSPRYDWGAKPWGLAIIQPGQDFPEGLLFVGYNNSIRVVVRYAVSGRYRHEFPVHGDNIGYDTGPRGMAVQAPTSSSSQYLLIVANEPYSAVHIYDALSGNHLRSIDGEAMSGMQMMICVAAGKEINESIFDNPYDVAVMPANSKYPGGAIYLASSDSGNVAVFDATTYKLITQNLFPGKEYPVATGIAACVDEHGRNVIFVSDSGDMNVKILVDG